MCKFLEQSALKEATEERLAVLCRAVTGDITVAGHLLYREQSYFCHNGHQTVCPMNLTVKMTAESMSRSETDWRTITAPKSLR